MKNRSTDHCVPRTLNVVFLCWILSIHKTYSLNIVPTAIITDDDKFVMEHGNDFETSGTWQQLRNVCKNDTAYMKRIECLCSQAHKAARKIEGDITIALCFTRQLIFRDSEKYKPIKLDIVCYIIGGLTKADGRPYYFYITKGLRPNCVYYLKPFTHNDTSQLTLDEHVCGVVM